MNSKSMKGTRKELAMPYSSIALAERKFATEIIEVDSLRIIPTIRYKSANLQIINTSFNSIHCFTSKERISVDLKKLKDGVYFYELSLIIDEESLANITASLKGKFVMSAGFSREYNSKWGSLV